MFKRFLVVVIYLVGFAIPHVDVASATSEPPSLAHLSVSLNAKAKNPIVITAPAKPDFDKDVLEPLRAAQKAAAEKAAQDAAAQVAAQAAAQALQQAASALAQQQAIATQQAAIAAENASYANTYDWGNCTWYVASRRHIPDNWGNARDWYGSAQAAGWATGLTPRAGAIGVSFNGWAGHVVYVESVNSDGSVNVSEMNVNGLGVVDRATYSAGSFVYIY